MFTKIGHFSVRRRRLVLALTGLFLVASAVLGGGVFDALKTGGFDAPGSESSTATDVLRDELGQGEVDVVLVFSPDGGDVDTPEARAAGLALGERLAAEDHVDQVVSYWSLGDAPPLRSAGGDRALIVADITGDEDTVSEVSHDLVSDFAGAGATDGGQVKVGGPGPVFEEIGVKTEDDLARAEAIAVPATLVLLVLIFGGLVAAGLPLFVGAVAVLGTFLTLAGLAQVTDVSIFAINLTTAMGLGLAIDYSLFVVSRFREELRRGAAVEDAVVHTVETAGRTVAFSALTVAVSLSALLVFPMYFMRSFAYAGVAVVAVAALASVVSLPALLAVLGHRVDKFRLFHRPEPVVGTGLWHRIAGFVMRRPVGIAGAVIAGLLVLGIPFLGVEFGQPDDRVLPEGSPARQVSDTLRTEFDANEASAFAVVVPGGEDGSDASSGTADEPGDGAIDEYAAELSSLDGVARVDAATGIYADGRQVAPAADGSRFRSAEGEGDGEGGGGGTWFNVVPAVEPISAEGEELVHAIRDAGSPLGEVLVGGSAAQLVDAKDAIGQRLPYAAAIIAVATFVLLFLMFGSLLVPVKAIVLNLLSLTATFGAMVWVFQEGHGSGLLDFTATGTLDTSTPILMFCIAFGLSMDYEVFLLSRIKEEHDRTGDNTASVAMGLERTGRIVTAAAALLAVTFVAMGTSQISFLKLFGLGLALAVVVDATIIRATLVPAFMRLAGEANWWAPCWMRRIHERFGISEAPPAAAEPAAPPASRATVDA